MNTRSLIFLLLSMVVVGCKTRPVKPDSQPANVATPVKTDHPGQAPPTAPQFPYRPSQTKVFDLIHTRLEVSFDWEKEQMMGKATLTMRPWFAPTNQLVLDAKGFVLHQVAIVSGDARRDLKYQYDNEKLTIDLDRSYTKEETLKVFIDYTARPSELEGLVSEEAADDQGLYFINPRGEEAGKPRQIWTQGESHGSPGWFPTFDTPNQRCTDEIYITVADSFETLSNGLMVGSVRNPDGSRTDHWQMDLPHAPYLFMMAIGNYAVIKDQWRGREVSYYVEPSYAPYAKLVFGETPAMMEFFSTKLGVDYAWPKYSQVVVRDFVSGAMENTSATTHYGRLQHDAREHLDNTEEDIISHELFHQWFGDLVTCESWANLSLNEGFATYGEYLWIEHRHGMDEATDHLLQDRKGYLRSALRGIFPIIRYHHRDAESMFDGHSYAKGGQVLHMLRSYVGDDAFFEALKRYLTENKFDDVEIHKLRMAFEEVTGEDLNWFFDQWFLQPGHPELELTHSYAAGSYSLRVQQVQDLKVSPIFRLPITLDYVVGDKHRKIQVWMESADTTFEFAVNAAPSHVCFNPDQSLLCNVRTVRGVSDEAWAHQLKEGEGFAQKAEAVAHMMTGLDKAADYEAILALAKADYAGTRMLALTPVEGLDAGQIRNAVEVALRLTNDPKAYVRAAAIGFMGEHPLALQPSGDAALRAQAQARLRKAVDDSSYSVSRSALETLYAIDSVGGMTLAEQRMHSAEPHLTGAIARILRAANSTQALPYVLEQLRSATVATSLKTNLLRGFGEWLDQRPATEKSEGMAVLRELVTGSKERWLRFFAVQAMAEMVNNTDVMAFFKQQVAQEEDNFVQTAMQRYIDKG